MDGVIHAVIEMRIRGAIGFHGHGRVNGWTDGGLWMMQVMMDRGWFDERL